MRIEDWECTRRISAQRSERYRERSSARRFDSVKEMSTYDSRITVILSEVEGYNNITIFFISFRMTGKVILSEVEGYNIYN